MLSPDIFHPYQDDSVTQLYERPRVLAIMPTGAGKTITGLTAFKELQHDGEARAGIILAPKRVAMSVWPSELHKWTHTQHMTVKAVSGTPAQRKAALAETADLHTVGMDNIVWLLAQVQTWKKDDPRLDLLVVDEVSRCKNARGAWAKALRKLAPLFKSVWLLTGTPRPNSDLEYYVYMDVVGQSKVWARSFDVWRREFFYPTDYEQRVWEPHRHMLPKLREDVARWSFRVPEDVVPRPKCDPIVHTVKLPRKVQVKYDEMEKALFTEIGDTDIVAFSKAVSSGKLAQIAQGFLYDDEKNAHFLHNEKMGMLEHVMDLNGPDASLILYHFNEDMRRLKDAFPGLEYIGEGVSDKRALELEDEWNAGNLERLAIHPACLHPETLVLTERRGWAALISVKQGERVHDGTEWVSHAGVRSAGFRAVTHVHGVVATPDHKFLVGGRWVEARYVRDNPHVARAARHKDPLNGTSFGAVPELQKRAGVLTSERAQGQQGAPHALRDLRSGAGSRHVRLKTLPHMAGRARPLQRPQRRGLQTLRREGHNVAQALGGFCSVLGGHARGVLGRFDTGTRRCERGLHAHELYVGPKRDTTIKQTEQQAHNVSRRRRPPSGILPPWGRDTRGDNTILGRGKRRRRGVSRLPTQHVPEGAKIEVFDLVDCGPRSRFLVKGARGAVFVVHNSAGHGLNLQNTPAQLCHYCLTWSAELYKQVRDRVARQGYVGTTPTDNYPKTQTEWMVLNHFIVAEGTVDELKVSRVRGKMTAEAAALQYIQSVRTR